MGTVAGILLTLGVVQMLLPAPPSPFDGNGDGYISNSEFRPFMASLFEQADANADGIADQSELNSLHTALRPSLAQAITITFRIIKLDRERDGKLSKDEVMNPIALDSVFKQLDKNSDQYLARGEGNALAFELLFPN